MSARRRYEGLGALPAMLLAALALASPARAGGLDFWESSSSPGVPRALASPANDVPLDIDYAPTTAEGGGLYGISEVLVYATGDLTLSATGFACQTFGCLYTPFPFSGGSWLLASGADNLPGEFASSQDLLTISVTGTTGYVAVVSGRYLDATGVLQSLGTIQDIDPHIIAEVPEPGFPAALGLGALGGAAAARKRSRHRGPESASAPDRVT